MNPPTRSLPRLARLCAPIVLMCSLLLISAANAPQFTLADPPRMPERPSWRVSNESAQAGPNPVPACSSGSQCIYLPVISNTNTPTDPRSRPYAVDLFNTAYLGSSGVASGWNGNIGVCDPGSTTQAFRDSVLLRLNYYREMAGLAKLTGFNSAYNTQDQAAALMMAANQALSHTPPNTWKCYTQTGYDGASSSNLALGAYGTNAIDLYMGDSGVGSLGHRRWVLYPQTQEMGTGDIAGSIWQNQSNALKAWDSHIWDPRPATRDAFVAWPPAGFIPYQVVYPAWSFAVAGADFTNAAVTVSSNGANVDVQVSHPPNGFGENTLAFTACSCSAWPKPGADTPYQVTISNVVVGGVSKEYSYTVTVIDPAR